MAKYQYTIPLECTEDGCEPAYGYPDGAEISKSKEDGYLVVVLDKAVPHFHKASVAVKVDRLLEHEVKADAGSS